MTTSGGRPAQPDRLRLFLGLTVPLVAFIVLRRVIGNATGALAISDALPLLGVVAIAIVHRKLDRLLLIPFGVFALALALSITFGGSALPLELRRSVFPGVVGIACLGSVAVRQPLLVVAARRVAETRGESSNRLGLDPAQTHRVMTVLTVMIGVTGLLDAAAQATLAFTVSATTFGEVARLASYIVIGGGVGACALYLHFVRRRHPSPTGRPS